jgi:hypothetical protein
MRHKDAIVLAVAVAEVTIADVDVKEGTRNGTALASGKRVVFAGERGLRSRVVAAAFSLVARSAVAVAPHRGIQSGSKYRPIQRGVAVNGHGCCCCRHHCRGSAPVAPCFGFLLVVLVVEATASDSGSSSKSETGSIRLIPMGLVVAPDLVNITIDHNEGYMVAVALEGINRTQRMKPFQRYASTTHARTPRPVSFGTS